MKICFPKAAMMFVVPEFVWRCDQAQSCFDLVRWVATVVVWWCAIVRCKTVQPTTLFQVRLYDSVSVQCYFCVTGTI